MRILQIKKIKELFKRGRNKRGYYDFVKTSLGVLVTVFVLFVFLFDLLKGIDLLERFELITLDYRMKFRRARESNERVVLVDMGEDSIKAIGRWPWPREWHATIISILSKYGAEAVVFDVIFSEKSSEFSDGALEEAMKKFGNVYIPYAIELEGYDEKKGRWNVGDIILPLERFSRWARGLGHITIVPDSDGSIRRIPSIVDYRAKVYPQLGLRVAADIKGFDPESYRIRKTAIGRYLEMDKEKRRLSIPVDKRNEMFVNWVAKWGEDFKHYSFIDVITSYRSVLANKKPIVDLAEFKDKICLIGLTAPGLYDIKPNPLQPAYPAVGTNANVINGILNEDFIRKAPRWIDSLIIIFLGLFLTMNIFKAQPAKGAFIAGAIAFLYILISFVVLDFMNTWISLIYPLAAMLSAYLVITFYNQIVIAIERAKLYTLATKDGLTGLFVVRHFNLLLEAEMERVRSRGGALSILMSDIDYFKKINDKYGHQTGDFILREVASILLSCCRQLDIPSRYGGEEFIVMLPGAGIADAIAVARRIRKTVEEHTFKKNGKRYNVTISMGVSELDNREDTREDFVAKADAALYRAKEEGRNRICLLRPGQTEYETCL